MEYAHLRMVRADDLRLALAGLESEPSAGFGCNSPTRARDLACAQKEANARRMAQMQELEVFATLANAAGDLKFL